MNRLLLIGLATLLITSLGLVGCVRVANGTWVMRSAAVPEGWPTPTRVGQVELKQYPVYRAATVEGGETDPVFMTLFGHIKDNDIAMTAPVDMGYDSSAGDASMNSMAFLYRTTELGQVGQDGDVIVSDVPEQTFASIGVRGDYTDERFNTNLATLNAWLDEQADTWEVAGDPRFLGYNGPFTPAFMRYGEVQVPVRPVE